MENKYKLRKVFDCQDMPEDLRREFFDLYDWCIGNDVYIEHTIQGSKYKYTLPNGTEVDDSGGPELEEDPNWHGWIDVWQLDKESYGADNCESYCYTNWKECLKVIEE